MTDLKLTSPIVTRRESSANRPKNKGQHSLQAVWERNRWLIIGIFWLVALSLGYSGFARAASSTGDASDPTTLLYLTLQLITMNSGVVAEPIPWQLNIARFLIPFLTASTLWQAFASIFREQLDLFRLQVRGNHTILCGLSHKGFALVKSLRQSGEQVVVIERDKTNGWLEPCRAYGAIVLIGNAADLQVLKKAAVAKAKTLIAICDDSTNTEIALQARQIMQDYPRRMLTCSLHIVDPQLYNLLRNQVLEIEGAGGFRLELFNVFERGAQLLVKELPWLSNGGSSANPCLMVIGLGQLGQNLVIHAARAWWESHRPITQRLRILAIDLEANWKTEVLHAQYPRLSQACELVPLEMDVLSPAFQRGDFLPAGNTFSQVNIFYICLDDDNLSLKTALSLQRLAGAGAAPIVVRVTERLGLANLLNRNLQKATAHGQNDQEIKEPHPLRAFMLLEQTCTPDLLLGGTHEVLAREIHANYLRTQLQAGKIMYSKDSLAPWDELKGTIKERNYCQVDRISQKLKAISCRLLPLTDWDASGFKFDTLEVELMAQMEHDAWVEQLIRDGWRYAADEIKLNAKTNPDLVAWEALSEAEKLKNRVTVEEMPRFLARAGFQIERLPAQQKDHVEASPG